MRRRIQFEDIKRGVVVHLMNLVDTYNTATIISVKDEDGETRIMLARPYAYANENYDSDQPLMGCEIFETTVKRMLADYADYEVYQGMDTVRNMMT
jgi:hypothetical protein